MIVTKKKKKKKKKKVINDVSEKEKKTLTFFANQTVVSIVGIVRVAKTTMGEFELEEFVAMLA